MYNTLKKYVWLFGVNLLISAFTFGGGYVVVPMIRKYFVQKKGLMQEEELLNLAAIAQSTPGAIAINLSALAGYQTAGIAGVAVSCVAAILPPIIILSFVSNWYTIFAANHLIAAILKGMQAGVAALMVDIVIDMSQAVLEKRSILLTCMMPAVFLLSFIAKVNIALILVICCCICVARVWFYQKRRNI